VCLHHIAMLLSTHKLKLYMIMLPCERHGNKRVKNLTGSDTTY
jgi:hypothetical protein